MANLSIFSLPLGTRFCPYDVELVMYYLRRKVTGRKFKLKRDIPDIVLKNHSPSEGRGISLFISNMVLLFTFLFYDCSFFPLLDFKVLYAVLKLRVVASQDPHSYEDFMVFLKVKSSGV